MKKILPMMLLAFLVMGASQSALAADVYEITASRLNVRSGPSTYYRVIGDTHASQKYVAITSQGSWLKIWFDGRTGWVYKPYTDKLNSSVSLVKIGISALNVRRGPGTGYGKVGVCHSPERYVLLGSSGSWKKVWFDGHSRWIYTGGSYATIQASSGYSPSPSTTSTSFQQIKNGKVLRRGDKGSLVKAMQQRLANLGFSLIVDGIYGPGTERTVKDFQYATGVSQTGNFGPTTLKYLNQAENFVSQHQQSSGSAWSSGKRLGTIKTIYIDGKPVKIEVALAYNRMKKAAANSGVYIKINSGFRTYAEQKSLYKKYLNGTGNLAAKPGYSNHQNGIALDLNTINSSVYSWLKNNAWKYGFKRTVPSEPWHWVYRP